VTIGATSNITLNTATGSGTINPNGGASPEFSIEYGKTKEYGQSTIDIPMQGGTTAVPVSAEMIGIEPLATYHWRIKATSGGGTTYSEDAIFEMPKSYRVGGVPVSKLEQPATFSDTYLGKPFEGGSITISGKTGNNTELKVTCHQGTHIEGVLGEFSGTLTYNNWCTVWMEGTQTTICTPKPIELQVNRYFAQTSPTKLGFSGENCPLPNLTLSGGGLGALDKVEWSGLRMEGTAYSSSGLRRWNIYLDGLGWRLNGAYAGKEFTVS
jgi:hypothetical protein